MDGCPGLTQQRRSDPAGHYDATETEIRLLTAMRHDRDWRQSYVPCWQVLFRFREFEGSETDH